MEWINVEDRLPQDLESVLIARSAKAGIPCVIKGMYIYGEFKCRHGRDFTEFVDPTHWMPLPPPPQENNR